MKNNIPAKTIGVYLIKNIDNGKKYVGSSNEVRYRVNQHFNSSCYDLYQSNQFYIDIKNLGKNKFECYLLEETTKENKLDREVYWYEKIKPEYNFIRPSDNNFKNKKVRQKANKNSNTDIHIKHRKELYNTDEYKLLFRIKRKNLRPVDVYKDNEKINTFISIRDTARWLDETTNYKSKNKASKVKDVCDGKRNKAFGYSYKYSTESVETILKRSRYSIDTNIEVAD